MKRKLSFLIVLCLIVWTKNSAQEKIEPLKEVVVSATKFTTEKEKVGKIIYQIKQEDLELQKGKTVIEILDNLAGLHINGTNNTFGKNKSTYIRGGRERQVLVLIDGIPVGDPSAITNSFDLRFLAVSQIESIEVMNGAASTLYGSGAAAGVINIKLKNANSKALNLNYQVSAGTNNTQEDSDLKLDELYNNISLSGSLDKFNYLASFNTIKSDGMSEAISLDETIEFEEDSFETVNSYIKLGYNFSEKLTIQGFVNIDSNEYDYDTGANSDSEINNGTNDQTKFGFSSNYKYTKGQFNINSTFNKTERVLDSYNSWSDATDHYEYTGKTFTIDAVNKYTWSDTFSFISGINYQNFKNLTNSPFGNIEDDLANYNTLDPYLSLVYNSLSGFNLNVGTRLNIHSEYGSHLVYNLNPSYNFSTNFKAIASMSSAFIAPSTYQLFSQYGNLELEPEKSETFEAGFEFSKQNKLRFNAVFFYREEENAILLPDFVTYSNSEDIITLRGLETEFNFNIEKDFSFKFGHTYVHKSNDVDYIPKHKFTAMFDVNKIKKTYLSLRFKNLSSRTYFDKWGTGENIKLDGYGLLDFYGSYQLIPKKLELFVHINNIANEDYVETIGYSTKGRNFKIGLDFKL